jgi:hypothetical protein
MMNFIQAFGCGSGLLLLIVVVMALLASLMAGDDPFPLMPLFALTALLFAVALVFYPSFAH